MNVSSAIGRSEASAMDVIYEPEQRANRNPVLWLHGGAATASQAVGVGLGSVPKILTAVCKRLFPIVAPTTFEGGAWVADADTEIDSAIAACRAYGGASYDKVVMMGSSFGGYMSLHYAATHPNDVACVIGFIPLVDIETIRATNDPAGLRGAADTALGVTYPAPVPSGFNLMTRTSDFVCPILLFTASDDTVSVNADDFSAATGAIQIDVGAMGHDNDAIEAAYVSHMATIEAFIEAAVANN